MDHGDPVSRLAQALRSGRPVVLAEYAPATTGDSDALKRLTAPFPRTLDAVVVASDGGMSGVALSTLLAAEGLEPMLVLATSDRNRAALLSDARGAALLGLRNVLCVTGDHPSLTATPEAAGTFDIDPVQLVQLLRDGDAAASALLVGAEVYPQLRPLELTLIDTRKKAAAGAGFLVTEPIFDVAAFEEWMTAVRSEGINERAAILATVQPLTSVEEAVATQRRRHIPDELLARLQGAADVPAEGVAACAQIAARAVAVEGVRGLFIRSAGEPEVVAEVMRRAGLPVA
jgi:methylenetetrahydrofolate reductase (NADPH)